MYRVIWCTVSKPHETDLAYPSLMLAQTELLGDVVATDYGYDWWWRFNANNGMNDTGYYSYLPYFTLYKFVKSANDVIAAVDVTDPTITDEMRGLGSIAMLSVHWTIIR